VAKDACLGDWNDIPLPFFLLLSLGFFFFTLPLYACLVAPLFPTPGLIWFMATPGERPRLGRIENAYGEQFRDYGGSTPVLSPSTTGLCKMSYEVNGLVSGVVSCVELAL
jgi:hypothetical protein